MTQTERNPRGDAAASAEPEIVRSGVPIVAIGASMVLAGIAAALSDGVIQPWLTAVAGAAIGAASTLMFGPTATARGAAESDGLRAASTSSLAHDEVLRSKAIEIRSGERTKLLDALGDAVVLVDLHGETRFANASATAMLGERAAIAGTRHAIESLPPMVMRAVTGVVAAGGTERRRIECALRDPGLTPVVIHIANIGGSEERLASIVVRDVRVERETDRIKDEFVAKANHELRTPLSSLRASAEMLADCEVSDDAQRVEFARIILTETDRLVALVDQMLDIERIESGMARADLGDVDLAALSSECVAEQQSEANRRHIALSISRSVRGATVSADRGLLKQVLLNLLSNALKYTPDGGRVAVEIDIDNLARSVVVSVRDNGLGVPVHAMPRLFGKFYRVDTHEKFAKGTGLGLNLCRNIVEAMHGGQIGVDSEVGQGSRFWFAIPMEQVGRKAA
jgi:two-component system phosphate regulon sensor histidine kinase PhoR